MKTHYLSYLMAAAAGLSTLAFADDETTTTYTTHTFAEFSTEEPVISGNLQATTTSETSSSGQVVYATTITTTDGSAIVVDDGLDAQVPVTVTFVLDLTTLADAINDDFVSFSSFSIKGGGTTSAYALLALSYTYTGTDTTRTPGDIALGIDIEGNLIGFWNNTTTDGNWTLYTNELTSIPLFTVSDDGVYSVNFDGLSDYLFQDSEGNWCITLTYVQDSAASTVPNSQGASVYDTEEEKLYSNTALASWANTDLTEITLNTTYITAVSVTTEAVDATEAGTLADDLQETVVPEPATATLSLLALAALAARRRRW